VAAGDRQVHVMGGADVIRQALALDMVDELTLIVAPVVLGGGKRLFDGFDRSLDLEQTRVRQSDFAIFLEYRIRR
jgi:dihydrofolate reductase